MLLASVFEDTFPAESELAAVGREVRKQEWEALCARETHHGRGYTDAFCDFEADAVAAAAEPAGLFPEARRLGVFLPRRSFNCFWTWLKIAPADAGVVRTLDTWPWSGMPAAVIDGHTWEGRRKGVAQTIVSGHYECHRRLGLLVRARGGGWQAVREQVHREVLVAR